MRYGLGIQQNFIGLMISRNEWMSSFYGDNWYEIENISDLTNFSGGMVEWRINSNDYCNIELAQKHNFTLVESLIKFKTVINDFKKPPSFIRLAVDEDIEVLKNIVKVCYFEHPKFYNRFKNLEFFTKEKSEEYYLKSLTNSCNLQDFITIVAEDEVGVYGFRVMKKNKDKEYSGVVAGVLPRAKGKNTLKYLQRGMSFVVGEEYIEYNATQLGNYQVIKNHIRENRMLDKIEHIFYKKIK